MLTLKDLDFKTDHTCFCTFFGVELPNKDERQAFFDGNRKLKENEINCYEIREYSLYTTPSNDLIFAMMGHEDLAVYSIDIDKKVVTKLKN